MKKFGYKRNIDLNKFDFNSIEKERYLRRIKNDEELKSRIKQHHFTDEQIAKSVSKEMIKAMDNWER